MYQIVFYKNSSGRSEIEEYIRDLREKKNSKIHRIELGKISAYIDLLSEEGLLLNTKYVKHLDGEIWELRPLNNRILFAYLYDNKFILLSHFKKQTRKTPKREIEKAKKLLKEYKDRRGINGR